MDLFDLIGPVMIGPSSSHTAGAARIGLTARMLLNEDVAFADIVLHGSFAKTWYGHGTDRALVGGLMGMHVDDPRIRNSRELAAQSGMKVNFTETSIRGAHPNTVRMLVEGKSGRTLTLEAASVGGGLIEVTRLDGMRISFTGAENTLIIHHKDAPGMIAAVSTCLASSGHNIATMQVYRTKAGEDAMMVLELDSLLTDDIVNAICAMKDVESAIFLRKRGA